ncbi:hypothetical protein ACFSTC_03610 [Nonomuraea ferruginea]
MDGRKAREDEIDVDRHVLEDIARAALARADLAAVDGEEGAATWEFRSR